MGYYRYLVLAPSGDRVSGSLEAPSEEAAEQTLWESGYRIVTLRAAWTLPPLDKYFPTLFGTKPNEIITFFRQLATLVESGIAVLPALELLQRRAGRSFRRTLAAVAQAVSGGASLSDAIKGQGQTFPPVSSRMVAVGERTGNLETVLRQLATHIEKEEAVVKRIRGAMAYPAFVVLLAIGVMVILVTAALPPLISLFEEFNARLPLPTRILLALSHFATAYKLHMAAAAAVTVGAIAVYMRRPAGRRYFDGLLLRLPQIGPIAVLSNAARFSGTTAILLKAGIPISEVMDLVIDTTENRIVRERLRDVREELLRGEGLSKPLARAKLFPSMLVQMVEVGEEAGTLDRNLETMADIYTREVDERIGALTAMLQPTLTLAVGGVVAFVALSIIMPMYQIMQSIREP